MIPVGAIAGGLGALGGAIFGQHGPSLTEGDINNAYRRGSSRYNPFVFNPNANDPALQLQNSRANNLYNINRGRGVNEVYRAGLGGSSIAMNSLQGLDTDYAKQLEDIGNQNLTQQRDEQLGLYNSDLNYQRQLQMARLQAISGGRQADAASTTGAIGALAGVAGQAIAGRPQAPGTGVPDFNGQHYVYIDPSQPWLGGYYTK